MVTRSERFASVDAARAHYETPFWKTVRQHARNDIARGVFGSFLGSSVKVEKGEKLNISTAILYGAQAFAAGLRRTMCGGASLACIRACLGETSGHGQKHMVDPKTGKHAVQIARVRRTLAFMEHKSVFWDMFLIEIARHARAAERDGMVPAIRPNGTTDTLWERERVTVSPATSRKLARYGFQIAAGEYPHMFGLFPVVQFYDYTKVLNRNVTDIPNYHLTYSYDGEGIERVHAAMARGMNVAVAFRARPGQFNKDGSVRRAADSLPEIWNGYPVFDADDTDARFTDPRGVICGLHVKGAENLRTLGGFVQDFPGMRYKLVGGEYMRTR
jgi:hypothetical protein